MWDDRRGILYRVDIVSRRLLAWDVEADTESATHFDDEVSTVVLGSEGPAIVAVGTTIRQLDRDPRDPVVSVEGLPPDVRFNDGKCDPGGRLWVGTISRARTEGSCALYRLSQGGPLVPVLTNVTVSNGLGWSPLGELMYFIDSHRQRVDVFDFEVETGDISNRRTLVDIMPTAGLPDGMTVDAEGHVWVALFGAGEVRRYSPAGEHVGSVMVPTPNPTSVAFGGPELATLFITTGRVRLTQSELRTQRGMAGALWGVEPGPVGLAPQRWGA